MTGVQTCALPIFGCLFDSIDLDCSAARMYLSNLKLSEYVLFFEKHSTYILSNEKQIDFCYLDSSNDAENTLQEFLIAYPKLTEGGCLMVDDCNEQSVELCKGDKLLPYLRENNIIFEHLETNQIVIRK